MSDTTASTKVYLEVDGEPVPARDCVWIDTAPCGCISGVMAAEIAGEVATTLDQAEAQYHENRKLRERAKTEGFSLSLTTHEAFRSMPFADCAHDPKWGVVRVDPPEGMTWGTADSTFGRKSYIRHIVPADSIPVRGEKYPPMDTPALCGKKVRGWWRNDDWVIHDCVTCRACEKAVSA